MNKVAFLTVLLTCCVFSTAPQNASMASARAATKAGTMGLWERNGVLSERETLGNQEKPGDEGGTPGIGTWKLNEARSKLSPGVPKNDTVVYEAAGDKVKVTVDGNDSDGKPIHIEWTGKFDGKDYPVTGDPTADTRSYKKVDHRTLELTVKKDGKVTVTGRIVVAADGKSRTVSTSGTSSAGRRVQSTAVYDKQ